MKLAVVLTPGEDGYIVAECPTLPGCVSQGKTHEEALNNIKEAIEGWLEVEMEKVGKEAPKGSKVYHIDTRPSGARPGDTSCPDWQGWPDG